MSAQDIGAPIHITKHRQQYKSVPSIDSEALEGEKRSSERLIKSIIILAAILLFFIVANNITNQDQSIREPNNQIRETQIQQIDEMSKLQEDEQESKMKDILKQNDRDVSQKQKPIQNPHIQVKGQVKQDSIVKQQSDKQQAIDQQPSPPLVANIHPLALNIKMQPSQPFVSLNKTVLKQQLKQMPMCIISMLRKSNMSTYQQLHRIIKSLNGYLNYRHYYTAQEEVPHTASVFMKPQLSQSYALYLRQIVHEHCRRGQIVVLADSALRFGTLARINYIYQTTNVWMTYQDRNQEEVHSITTFYSQLLLRVSGQYLLKHSNQQQQLRALTKSLYLLAQYRAYSLNRYQVYAYTQQSPPQQSLHRWVGRLDPYLQAEPTMPSISLSQYGFQSRYNIYYYQTYVESYNPSQPTNRIRRQRNNITKAQMQYAIQYLQLKQLPNQHILVTNEKQYYNSKYNISQYEINTDLCVIVPSYNNVQSQRYMRVIDSILQQDYDTANYHVVIVDDYSNDSTLQLTRAYVQQAKRRIGQKTGTNISDVKFDYIRNTQRKYSTYNIYNAVYTHCQNHQVVVLIDGDDQIIGSQVFKLINYAYSLQHHQFWVVYFSHMSSDFGYGTSKHPSPQLIGNQFTPRIPYHAFGALRTFYAKLYRKIKIEDHQDMDGHFWTTIYDDALQYPLFQMAGPQHILYIPEIVYFYNRFYGNNDDSARNKIQYRKQKKSQILRKPKYLLVSNL